MTDAPGWAWAAAGLTICCLLVLDLAASRRGSGMSRAVLVSAAWVGAGIAFGLVVALSLGGAAGQEYFAAYLIEKSLSVDNLFIFAVLFRAFAVPADSQHRVLFLGVLGALALRGGFIAAGAALIHQVSWVFYVFGAVLLVAAIRMARGGPQGIARGGPQGVARGRQGVARGPRAGARDGPRAGPGGGFVLRGLRKIMPVTEDYDGARFLTRRDGRLAATPLLVALVAIETTDLIFAIDSIPAAFGVTTDVFIIFTSNAFAILGLRALYFVLAGAMERFTYLSQGLAVLLAFIGAKMIISPVLHLPTAVSLSGVVVIITSAILLSVWKRRRLAAAAPGGGPALAGGPAGCGSAPGGGPAPAGGPAGGGSAGGGGSAPGRGPAAGGGSAAGCGSAAGGGPAPGRGPALASGPAGGGPAGGGPAAGGGSAPGGGAARSPAEVRRSQA